MGSKSPIGKKNQKIKEKTQAKNALKADSTYLLAGVLVLGVGGFIWYVMQDQKKQK